uniref:D7 protein n=1 Tax=Anopheles culicifacies TaxID=139723 RepID=A0A182M3J4_9DIPT
MQSPVHVVHLIPFLLLITLTKSSPSLNSNATFDDRSSALSPDDTLFAHLRCFEMFASKQSDQRDRDASIWMGWDERYLQATDRTPKFMRCVLNRLRFIDASSEQFDENILRTQYNEYKRWLTVSEADVEEFINDINEIGQLNATDDDAVYDAFVPLFYNHSKTFFQLFLRDAVVLQNMYDDKIRLSSNSQLKTFSVREPNQTVVQFCELQMSTELWDDICRIRAYEISNHTEAMERHIACIFRGFQYLHANDSINEEEIARDYDLIGSLDAASRLYIQQCAIDASHENEVPKRSLTMYSCLLDGVYRDAFKEAFDFHEIRSGNLTFVLKNLPYDRAEVKQQILALDKEHCNDQQQMVGRSAE